jgi:C_GCAxxG_C_C family probable redox protein
MATTPGPLSWDRRCLNNALRMGHCAPTVMQTLLEERGRPDEDMVRCAGGLAGGIGGPGECGGISSPLMLFGLLHGTDRTNEGLPRVIPLGQEYLRRFDRVHGSTRCPKIMARGLRSCLKAMCLSPALFTSVAAEEQSFTIEEPTRAAYLALLGAFERERFHCAHSVFDALPDCPLPDQARRASWGFVGGLLLSGLTCGALAAGVMAISSRTAGIERSYLRTLRMVLTMQVSLKSAMRDDLNAANRAVRLAANLARRFEGEYGTIRCRDLTGADFSSPSAVETFCATGLAQCAQRAKLVATMVSQILVREGDVPH